MNSREWSYPYLRKTGAYPTLLLLTTICLLSTVATAQGSTIGTGTGTGSGTGAGAPFSSPCAPQHWWNQVQGKCTPCTICQGDMFTKRPCQLHMDTVCGSLYMMTEPNWKERRKMAGIEYYDQSMHLQHFDHQQLQTAAALTHDWQTSALFVAMLACLVFFSVAACVLIHHMRQWRRMERRLDQDVEELSTKLMAKLAEVQSLDGGTFFIGNADALRGLPAAAISTTTASAAAAASAAQSGLFQPQHVLMPAEKHSKHQERRILKTLQPGNVYIEESNGLGFGGLIGSKG